MMDDKADDADTDANAGHGCDQPPPADRERRRDSGAESGDQPADGAGTCQCLGGDSESDGETGESDGGNAAGGGGDTGGDGGGDGGGDTGGDGGDGGDQEPSFTERCRRWLKLWRVILLVILALVRLVRAL
ncbi:MAG: hypothetical protein ABEH81_14745 [Halopenitus sp.]